jgi:serine/threonine-protein kinase RsbT
MTTIRHETVTVNSQETVVLARQTVKKWAAALGFSITDQTKLVTATSELARNMLIYAGGGVVYIEELEVGTRRGLQAVFEDHGPGIPDITLALTDGYTTGTGMGLGLSGSKRLVDDFDIHSEVGQGTRVVIIKWK